MVVVVVGIGRLPTCGSRLIAEPFASPPPPGPAALPPPEGTLRGGPTRAGERGKVPKKPGAGWRWGGGCLHPAGAAAGQVGAGGRCAGAAAACQCQRGAPGPPPAAAAAVVGDRSGCTPGLQSRTARPGAVAASGRDEQRASSSRAAGMVPGAGGGGGARRWLRWPGPVPPPRVCAPWLAALRLPRGLPCLSAAFIYPLPNPERKMRCVSITECVPLRRSSV